MPTTSSNWTPGVTSGNVLTTDQQHVVVTYGGQSIGICRNGNLKTSETRTDGFTWESSYRFMLDNECTNRRPRCR